MHIYHQFSRSFEVIRNNAYHDCRFFGAANLAELCLYCNICEDVYGKIGRTVEASECLSISRLRAAQGAGTRRKQSLVTVCDLPSEQCRAHFREPRDSKFFSLTSAESGIRH